MKNELPFIAACFLQKVFEFIFAAFLIATYGFVVANFFDRPSEYGVYLDIGRWDIISSAKEGVSIALMWYAFTLYPIIWMVIIFIEICLFKMKSLKIVCVTSFVFSIFYSMIWFYLLKVQLNLAMTPFIFANSALSYVVTFAVFSRTTLR